MSPANHNLRYRKLYIPLLVFCLGWIGLGLMLDTPEHLAAGLRTIFLGEDMLICDYMETAGLGAAFINVGLVCLVSLTLLYFTGEPLNGFTLVVMGLMCGFSLFGKNLVNIIPIILGTWLYAQYCREPFSKHVSISLLATALSPMVSYLAFHKTAPMPLLAIAVGILIGFVAPPLAAHTFRIQNGMNLYNAGFACGILGMVLVPILAAMDHTPTPVLYWAKGYNVPIGIGVLVACAALIAGGLAYGRKEALQRYWRLLHTTGRLPSDYLRTYGLSTISINMGVNGILGLCYIIAVGGDLNGPTLGGIITIMGFSAYGKHAFNIAPVMFGVLLGNWMNRVELNDPSMQLAGLFGTTLAPISGVFGWPYGILAGVLHSSVVLRSGAALEGMNLYNNGFSGGLISIVLYPVLTSLIKHRRPILRDHDLYSDVLERDEPLEEKSLDVKVNEEASGPETE